MLFGTSTVPRQILPPSHTLKWGARNRGVPSSGLSFPDDLLIRLEEHPPWSRFVRPDKGIIRLPRLLQEMKIARGDGSYGKLLSRFAKYALLIIDDWACPSSTTRSARICLRCWRTGMGLARPLSQARSLWKGGMTPLEIRPSPMPS